MHVVMGATGARTRSSRRARLARGPLAVAFSLASLALRSPNARAETPQQIAETHFKAGLKLYNQESFEAARLEFLQGQAVFPRASLLRNLALCELKTNRPLDALRHLRAYLADAASDTRDYAKKNLDDAYARTGHLTVRATEGAAVSVDEQAQGNAPLKDPLDVLPGKHALEARIGERKLARDVDALAGSLVDVDLRFEEKPAPVGVGVGAGAPAGSTESPHEPAPSYWTPTKVGGVGAWAGAVGGFVAGGLLLQGSSDKAADGRAATGGLPTCVGVSSDACDQGRSAQDASGSLKTGGVVALATGGALAVTGALLFFWPAREKPSSSATNLEVRGTTVSLTHHF